MSQCCGKEYDMSSTKQRHAFMKHMKKVHKGGF